MIIKIDRSYNDKVTSYLNKDIDLNMSIINDIEKYGYDNNFLDVWAEIDKSGKIKGILLRYFQHLNFYSHSKFNVDGFCQKINDIDYLELSGKSDILKQLHSKLHIEKTKKVKFCVLNSINDNYRDIKPSETTKKIRFGNLNKIVKLYKEIDEFENASLDDIKGNLKTGRGYYIEKNKKAVAMAKSTNESKTHAMIIGVATHPEYRSQGLATSCVLKICKELINENKKPCLFYEDERAGRIYKKIGFKEVGNWSIYYTQESVMNTITNN